MSKSVKCQQCAEKSELLVMKKVTKVSSGKTVNKYYHHECYEEFLKAQHFKEVELKELQELVRIIAKVHGIPRVPNEFYPLLQDLRNGTTRRGGLSVDTYKEGVPYSLIRDTYLACEWKIDQAKVTKRFKNTIQELRYCLATISNSIGDLYRVQENKKKIAKSMERKLESKQLEMDEQMQYEPEKTVFKKQKREGHIDISHLVDDDIDFIYKEDLGEFDFE